jgi:hypothetical protein
MAYQHNPEPDPDHHLWRNGRLYWVAFTVHLPGWQKERIRLSLGTADVAEARRRRDQLLADYPRRRQCQLSLRVVQRGRRYGRQPEVAA